MPRPNRQLSIGARVNVAARFVHPRQLVSQLVRNVRQDILHNLLVIRFEKRGRKDCAILSWDFHPSKEFFAAKGNCRLINIGIENESISESENRISSLMQPSHAHLNGIVESEPIHHHSSQNTKRGYESAKPHSFFSHSDEQNTHQFLTRSEIRRIERQRSNQTDPNSPKETGVHSDQRSLNTFCGTSAQSFRQGQHLEMAKISPFTHPNQLQTYLDRSLSSQSLESRVKPSRDQDVQIQSSNFLPIAVENLVDVTANQQFTMNIPADHQFHRQHHTPLPLSSAEYRNSNSCHRTPTAVSRSQDNNNDTLLHDQETYHHNQSCDQTSNHLENDFAQESSPAQAENPGFSSSSIIQSHQLPSSECLADNTPAQTPDQVHPDETNRLVMPRQSKRKQNATSDAHDINTVHPQPIGCSKCSLYPITTSSQHSALGSPFPQHSQFSHQPHFPSHSNQYYHPRQQHQQQPGLITQAQSHLPSVIDDRELFFSAGGTDDQHSLLHTGQFHAPPPPPPASSQQGIVSQLCTSLPSRDIDFSFPMHTSPSKYHQSSVNDKHSRSVTTTLENGSNGDHCLGGAQNQQCDLLPQHLDETNKKNVIGGSFHQTRPYSNMITGVNVSSGASITSNPFLAPTTTLISASLGEVCVLGSHSRYNENNRNFPRTSPQSEGAHELGFNDPELLHASAGNDISSQKRFKWYFDLEEDWEDFSDFEDSKSDKDWNVVIPSFVQTQPNSGKEPAATIISKTLPIFSRQVDSDQLPDGGFQQPIDIKSAQSKCNRDDHDSEISLNSSGSMISSRGEDCGKYKLVNNRNTEDDPDCKLKSKLLNNVISQKQGRDAVKKEARIQHRIANDGDCANDENEEPPFKRSHGTADFCHTRTQPPSKSASNESETTNINASHGEAEGMSYF